MSTSFRPWAKPFKPNLGEHHVFALDPTATLFALSTLNSSVTFESSVKASTAKQNSQAQPPVSATSTFRPWAKPFNPASKEHHVCLLDPQAPYFTANTPVKSSAPDSNEDDVAVVASKVKVNATTSRPGTVEGHVHAQAGTSTKSELHGDAYEFLPGRKKHFENLRTSSTDPLRAMKCKSFLSYLSDPDFWAFQAQKSNSRRELVLRLREDATHFVAGASAHYLRVRVRTAHVGGLTSKLNPLANYFVPGGIECVDSSSSNNAASTTSLETALVHCVDPLSIAVTSARSTQRYVYVVAGVDSLSEKPRGLPSHMSSTGFGLCLRPNPMGLCFFWMLLAFWRERQRNSYYTSFDWAEDAISASGNDDTLQDTQISGNEYNPSQPTILYNGEYFHHVGFFGDVLTHKSSTSASLSLAVILKGAKPALAEENTENLYTRALVQNARKFVDPIVDSSARGREDYANMTMSEVQKEVTGQAHKFYLPGPWIHDHHNPDDDLILSDDEPCNDEDMPVGFLRNVYSCRESILSTSDTNGAIQRLLLRDEASEIEKAQRKPKRISAWVPSSSLCLSFTPDSMVQADKNSLIVQVLKLAFMELSDEAAVRMDQKTIIRAAAEEVACAVWKSKYKQTVKDVLSLFVLPTSEELNVVAIGGACEDPTELDEEEFSRTAALSVERPDTALGYYSESDDDAEYWEDVEPDTDDVEPMSNNSNDASLIWLDLAVPSDMFSILDTTDGVYTTINTSATANFETSSMPDLTDSPYLGTGCDEEGAPSSYLIDEDQDTSQPEELHVVDVTQFAADLPDDNIIVEDPTQEPGEPSDPTTPTNSSRQSSSEHWPHDSSTEATDDEESLLMLEEKCLPPALSSASLLPEDPAMKNATNLFGILTQAASPPVTGPKSLVPDSHSSMPSTPTAADFIQSYSLAFRTKPPAKGSEALLLPKLRQAETGSKRVNSQHNLLESFKLGQEYLSAIQEEEDEDQNASEELENFQGEHSEVRKTTADRAGENALPVTLEPLLSVLGTSIPIEPQCKGPFSLRKYQKRKSDVPKMKTIKDVPVEVDDASQLQGEIRTKVGSAIIAETYTASSVPIRAARPAVPFANSSILNTIESSTAKNPFSAFDGAYTHTPYKYADTPFWNIRPKSTPSSPSTSSATSHSAMLTQSGFDTSRRDRLRQFSSQSHSPQPASRRKRFSAWFWKKLTPRKSATAPPATDTGEGNGSRGRFGSIKSFIRSTLRRKN